MSNTYQMADDSTVKASGGGVSTEEHSSILSAIKADPIKAGQELIQACELGMQQAEQRWARYRRKYRRGNRYLGADLNNAPMYSTNYMFNVVETLKSNLTRYLPEITVQPQEFDDTQASEVMTSVLHRGLDRANFKFKLKSSVHHGAITGYGYTKVAYDPDAYRGEGEVVMEVIAPEDFLRLPYELDFYDASLFIHRVRDMSADEIKATYDKDMVKGEYTPKIDKDRSIEGERKFALGKTHDVYEIWIKNFEERKWYYITISGETVLKELTENPYDHGKAPFTCWYDNYDEGADQTYSLASGELEEIEALQDYADALDARIYKNIKQIVARQKILNPASGINKTDVDDTPSRVYLCTGRPQDAMMWDAPPSLSNDVYMTREKIEDRIQIVTGIFEVTQGQKPSGIQAAKAISALQQAGQARFEYKTETLLETIAKTCGLVLETQIQFYSDERIIRLEGGSSVKIAGSYPEGIGQQQIIDPITGEMLEGAPQEEGAEELAKAEWKQQQGIDLVLEDIDFKYDLKVSTHSSLPADRGQRSQLHFDLFRVGAVDRQALLDGLDYPNKSEVLKRLAKEVTGKTPPEANPDNQQAMQEAQMQKAQIEQMAQQGGGYFEE